MRPHLVITGLWLAWALSWIAAAGWSNRTETRLALRAQLGSSLLLAVGGVLMFVPAHGYDGPLRLWHVGWTGAWACTALVAMGIAIAWWARLSLGRLWSARITRKADHQIVDSGPYAFVRHPIYSGLLLSLLATAVAKGTVLGVAAFLLLVLGIWSKARLEERWLSMELGADAHAAYRRRVPMLLPSGRTKP
jgi:protein-S-isoprenylcysteine O-methyltransferase Ste14